ncbi:MAG TPA: thioredoxin domain-containing protein [Allosphingosinicella sp.]|nr:thioredoxin domain-containing protein [Allosphingosinicella sp.]
MKGRLLAAALAGIALAALPAADGAAQKGKAAVQRDWTQTVARTPEGGFRMGNPDAPVKLIEYLSFACPHCAEFHHESGAALFQNYVRPGRVSIEYRNILINAADIPATVLARCAGGRAYFNMGHELMGSQRQWLGAMQGLSEAQRGQLRNQPPTAMAQRLAPMLGLDRIAARYGLTPAAQRACLSNMANFSQLEAISNQAHSQYGVEGTPTFVINGRVVTDTNAWPGIEPRLRGG